MKNNLCKIVIMFLVFILVITGLTACKQDEQEPQITANQSLSDKEKVEQFIAERLPEVSDTYETDIANEAITFYAEGNILVCETKLEASGDALTLLKMAMESQMKEPSPTAIKIAKELRKYLNDSTATYVARIVDSNGELVYELAVPLS